MITRDIRQEPAAPVSALTYSERMLLLDLGRAIEFYRYDDRWGPARSERTHADAVMRRVIEIGLAKIGGKALITASLTADGIWFYRTLIRRAEHGLVSSTRTTRIVAQEPRGEACS